jgi:hypothetical protein
LLEMQAYYKNLEIIWCCIFDETMEN